ncbi:MAG: TauD/TfdA family dioxygenase [Proteobacteria bacterium]|nr:TauD/TfdA family dioxygenase [Pseudomonadota bacterium]
MTTELKGFSWTPQSLRVEWRDGHRAEFASLWLRDNCPADRDPGNGQRLVDIADVPPVPRLSGVEHAADAVLVDWQDEPRHARFELDWLREQSLDRRTRRPELDVQRWLDGADIDARRRFVWRSLAALESDAAARLDWLVRLAQDGIAFLTEVPGREREILRAMSAIGQVAETNYGLLFDVRSVAQPENLAYSDHGLGLHTDNPYRDPVPGFQALHVLAASPEGGDSLFADGFALAEHLRSTEPAAFEVLSRTPVPFLYRSRDAELYAETPLIRLNAAGAVQAVHYNNRSIAPLPLAGEALETFYAAYRRFALLLREPRFQVRLKLVEGDLVVFDNQRTLHGRTAFSSARFPRHLQGCYLTRDSVLSRLGLLRRAAHGAAR